MSPCLIFLFPILTQGCFGFPEIYFSPQDGSTSLENYVNLKTNSEDPEKAIDPEDLFKEGLKLYGKRKSLSKKGFLDRKVEQFVRRMYRRKPVSGKIRLLRKK